VHRKHLFVADVDHVALVFSTVSMEATEKYQQRHPPKTDISRYSCRAAAAYVKQVKTHVEMMSDISAEHLDVPSWPMSTALLKLWSCCGRGHGFPNVRY